jgi:general secretion pathway protein H
MNKHGFTLLELVIVLFLVSLIMGLSALYFANTLPTNKLNATVRDLSATIRYARSLAQIEGSSRTLTIDFDARRYGIEGLPYKNIDPVIRIMALDPSAGEITNGLYHLVFHASGGMEGGTIVLAGGKKEMRIELNPVVGSVVIK